MPQPRPSGYQPGFAVAGLGLYDSRVLSIRGVSKAYDGPRKRIVFTGVDLELATGEYVAVMGESGIGKSTLLNLIAGLERPDAGTIEVDGVDLARLNDDALTRLRGERMGFVFQAFHILSYLSVGQNVELPLRLQHAPTDDVRARTTQMLEAVGLGDRAGSMPRELSGGELQRVAIARALAHRPKLVLADEPTGNLDPDSARQVLDLLRSQIKDNNAAGILVTHSRTAADTTDRVCVLTAAGLRGA
jgi:putative ABC transport system ATP-binding protein